MLQALVSILFHLTFILYLFLGVYTLSLNSSALKSRIFFGVCLVLSIWAFGAALFNLYADYTAGGIAFLLWGVIPIFLIIPALAVALIIKKSHRMTPQNKAADAVKGDILDLQGHQKFFQVIALVYCVTGILIVTQIFFYPSNLFADILFSSVYIFLGISTALLPTSGLTFRDQDWVLTVIMGITCPFTLFMFTATDLGNVVWCIPMIYLLLSVIFNRVNMFLVLSVITIATGLLMLILQPETSDHIHSLSYVARLVVYGVVILLAIFINRIYIARLRENDQQASYQIMTANMTRKFISVAGTNFDEKINDLLRESAHFIQADRAYLVIYKNNYADIEITHRWRLNTMTPESAIDEEGTRGVPEHLSVMPAMPWSRHQILNNELLLIPSQQALPAAAKGECEHFRKFGILAQVKVPIFSKDRIIGYLGYDQLFKNIKWEREDLEKLRILANIIGDAFVKVGAEAEKNYLAYYDALTGLPNRNLFYNRLEQSLELAKRTKKSLGVIFIDIDGFKEVNDTEGHDWGDHLLNEIGGRLQSCVRQYDTVARFGGDEFLILIPQIEVSNRAEDLTRIGEKIMAVFREYIAMEDQKYFITASAGIAVYPDDGETIHDLIKHGDLAMYAAKANGKSQFAFCSQTMKAAVQERMNITNQLHLALERNELFLNYQPQVSLATNQVVGFEALLRWRHPKLGLVPPSVFIPIAEQAGLISSIGEWVLMTACAQNKAWQNQGYQPIQMSVNLSVEQFRSSNLVEIVRKCLTKTGLEPHYLELEITESIAMEKSRKMNAVLNALKAMGVTISIDDFGTEFSSLARLKELPVDRLKIDMEFIRGIGKNPKDEALISVMILLSKRLGLKVIAEGGETKEQIDFLTAAGCDEVQGYYFYKPLSKEEIKNQTDILVLPHNRP